MSNDNQTPRVSRRKFLRTGASAAVVAAVAGIGGVLTFQASRGGPAPTAPAIPEVPTAAERAQAVMAEQPREVVVGGGREAAVAVPVTPAEAMGAMEMKALLPSVVGATPAERAVNAIQQIRDMGRLPENARVKFLLVAFATNNIIQEPEGNVHPLSGWKGVHIGKEFTRQTGIPVDIDTLNDLELYEKAISEGITKAGTWDFMSVRMDFLYDFQGADAILETTPFVEAYNPEFESGPCPLFPGAGTGNYKIITPEGKATWWGYPVCDDWFTQMMRVDIMKDPKEQADFEKQWGYELRPTDPATQPDSFPSTWNQVQDMAEHFFRPDADPPLFGGYYFRDPWFSNLEFYIRFYELGGLFFDRNMNITIDTPQYRKAIEDMKALTPYMDPISFKCSWPCMYPDYSAGKAFQTITWGSLNQFGGLIRSGLGMTVQEAIKAFGAYGIPGYVTNGQLVRNTVLYDQTSYMVAKHGKLTKQVPDISYLFGQFISDPEISTQALANPGAISDGWRTCHFTDPRLVLAYATDQPPNSYVFGDWTQPSTQTPPRRGAMETYEVDLARAAPPLQISGLKELQDLMGTQQNAYFTGLQDIDTTTNNVQAGWERVVDRFGRERVFKQWRDVVNGFPPVLRTLHADYIQTINRI
ncbi:MAG: hypothetical protein ACE5KO_00230 [Candidatus Bathyarchaeia archaeon]